MRLRIHPLESHGFAAITVEHAARPFIVNMNNLCFGYISNGISLLFSPLRPCQILQSSQHFIVWILLPQTFSNGGIGVIAKGCLLPELADIGIPLMENLPLRELCRSRSALFAVGQRDIVIFKRM